MPKQEKKWFYLSEAGEQRGPFTLEELDALRAEDAIHDYTTVANLEMLRRSGPMAMQQVAYSRISRIEIEFTPSVEEFRDSRQHEAITVLSGSNNGGKSFLLKNLYFLFGHDALMLSCNRFSHVDVLNTREHEQHNRQYFEGFSTSYYMTPYNSEDNSISLEAIITGLRDTHRDRLFDAAYELLGNRFSLNRTRPDNTFSPFYIDMDGENLRYGSSGTRLLLTLMGVLLDERFSVLLIDEPEIGLSPRIQSALARLLYSRDRREMFCPHLKHIYVVTHSHLFLDRQVFSNNHIVAKSARTISIKGVQSIGDLHQLQFNMLGNELESIFLPSAIVIVEGESDVMFIGKVVQLRFPDRKIAVVRAGGDGEMQNKIQMLKEALGELSTSPFRDRLFIVLDKTNSVRVNRIESQGIRRENISVWTQNGIEYYYPPELLRRQFCCSEDEVNAADRECDPIEINDIRKSKKELARSVTEQMTSDCEFNPEVELLLGKIGASLM